MTVMFTAEQVVALVEQEIAKAKAEWGQTTLVEQVAPTVIGNRLADDCNRESSAAAVMTPDMGHVTQTEDLVWSTANAKVAFANAGKGPENYVKIIAAAMSERGVPFTLSENGKKLFIDGDLAKGFGLIDNTPRKGLVRSASAPVVHVAQEAKVERPIKARRHSAEVIAEVRKFLVDTGQRSNMGRNPSDDTIDAVLPEMGRLAHIG